MQLEAYFQRELPREKELNAKVKPLLRIIKESCISSYRQLERQLKEPEKRRCSERMFWIGRKDEQKKKIEELSIEKNKKSISSRRQCWSLTGSPRNIDHKIVIAQRQNKSQMLPQSNANACSTRGIRPLDFEVIDASNQSQTMLANKFQTFIHNLNNKQKTQMRSRSVCRSKRVRLVDNEEALDIFQQTPVAVQGNLFKVKIRKRFWQIEKRKGKNQAIGSNTNSFLCVWGKRKANITIQ